MKIKIILSALILVPTITFSQWTLNHTFPSTLEHIQVVGSTIYAANGLHGIYASHDNGVTWIQKNNNVSDTLVRAFYADDTLLMASVAGNGGGINISYDGGNTWSVSSSGINYPSGIFSVAKSGNNLLCGTFGTFAGDSAVLYLSTNNGITWTPQVTISWTSGFPAFAVKDSFVVASTYSGEFYYSTDYGVTYNPVNTPFTSEDMVITNSTIVVANSSAGINSIDYSTDNGLSWQTGKDTVSANDFKNKNDTVYAATLLGFFYSLDGGMNWFENNNGLPVSKQCYAVGVTENDLWLAHHSGGLYKLPLSQITSVSEQQNNFGFTVFPNPANESLVISHLSVNENYEIKIMDVMGKQILKVESSAEKTEVNVTNFESGIYFIEIISDENKIRWVEKVVINH